MRIQWYGQSAFALTGDEASVFIDPFGDMTPLAGRGVQFEYPAIDGVAGRPAAGHPRASRPQRGRGDRAASPTVLRSTAGKLESPIGEIVAVASEHDEAAGTERGPNTIFVFDARRRAGRPLRRLRPGCAARRAGRGDRRGRPGVPAGRRRPDRRRRAGPAIVDRLRPRWVVPMHYRTHQDRLPRARRRVPGTFGQVHRADEPSFETADLPSGEEPVAVVPATP